MNDATPDPTRQVVNPEPESTGGPDLHGVCQALVEPDGDHLIRLIAALFDGRDIPTGDPIPDAVIRQAVDLGLIVRSASARSLTSFGFLVASAAKEYRHWIDNGRRMPPPRPPDAWIDARDVLDLGCSFGRWLWEFQTRAKSVIGLELQPEFIHLGNALAQREKIAVPTILHDSAENLAARIPPESIDLVFSRLVLNHVDIRKTLPQIARVLRPGGIAWIQINTFCAAVKQLLRPEKRLRSKVFQAFSVWNSLLFTTTGLQMTLRAPGRMLSVHKPAFPSLRRWKKSCQNAGLTDFHIAHRNVETAAFWVRKPPFPDLMPI